jgi:hypothetical protein
MKWRVSECKWIEVPEGRLKRQQENRDVILSEAKNPFPLPVSPTPDASFANSRITLFQLYSFRTRLMLTSLKILLFLILVSAAQMHTLVQSLSSSQIHFSAEDAAVKQPVPLPADVLKLLAADEVVRDTIKAEGLGTKKPPSSWFSTSVVNLSPDNGRHLLVMAIGPLRGANVTHFWIFQTTSRGYRLVLNAPAHDVIVKNTTSFGLRDIELVSMSAVTLSRAVCRFNGKHYVVPDRKLVPINGRELAP